MLSKGVSLMLTSLLCVVGCIRSERTDAYPPMQPGLYPLSDASQAPRQQDSASGLPASATLDSFIEAALSTHPSLRLHHARWARHHAQSQAALRWQDPVLTYTFAPLPIETRLGAQRHIISLEQPLPWPGREARASEVFKAQARAQAATFDAAYLTIRREVSDQYWALWHSERKLALLRAQQDLLEGIEQGTRAQVEVGRQPASALTRIAMKRVQLDERIQITRTDAQVQADRLLATLGVVDAPDVLASPLSSEPLASIELEEVDELVAHGVRPPHLLAMAHQTQSEREALELARLNNRPTFRLGAQWSLISASDAMTTPEAGRDAVMVKVGMSLPVWRDARHAKVEAAEAAIVASQSQEELALIAWAQRLRTTRTLILDVQRQLKVHETTLLPMARASFDMARGDYEVERAEFTAVLQTLDTLLVLQLAQLDLRTTLAQHMATWEWLKGQPATSITPKDAP